MISKLQWAVLTVDCPILPLTLGATEPEGDTVNETFFNFSCYETGQ